MVTEKNKTYSHFDYIDFVCLSYIIELELDSLKLLADEKCYSREGY